MSEIVQQMDGKAASQRVCPAVSCGGRHGLSPSRRSECEFAFGAGRGQTLVLVLLVSLGLWAMIWGAVSLLGALG